MVGWLEQRFDNNGVFIHSYTDRATHERWLCDGLFDAFRQYSWKRKGWASTKDELDRYRAQLRAAVATTDRSTLSAVCKQVLQWGGVSARNGAYVDEPRDILFHEVTCLAKVL